MAFVPPFDCRPMQRHPRVIHRAGVIGGADNGVSSQAGEEMPNRQGTTQWGRFQFVKNTRMRRARRLTHIPSALRVMAP
jgi:hypothetical protein